jgi:hypothetical protein
MNWLQRQSFLAAVLGLGLVAASASAQYTPPIDANGGTPPITTHGEVQVVNPLYGVVAPIHEPSELTPLQQRKRLCPTCHRILNRCNFCCWGDHTYPGTGNLHSELVFLFGSSRKFFREPCLGSTPPAPVPEGYDSFPAGAP